MNSCNAYLINRAACIIHKAQIYAPYTSYSKLFLTIRLERNIYLYRSLSTLYPFHFVFNLYHITFFTATTTTKQEKKLFVFLLERKKREMVKNGNMYHFYVRWVVKASYWNKGEIKDNRDKWWVSRASIKYNFPHRLWYQLG